MASTATTDPAAAIGRTETRIDAVDLPRVAGMAATLGVEAPAPGAPLPPGWHWLFFNGAADRADIGHDGHPKLGGFLPDTGLPRRMWAGGRLSYLAPIPVGAEVVRDSEILDVSQKSGRSGRLCFVTVRHRISANGTLCIEEEQDIVYRDPPAPDAPAPKPAPAPEGAEASETVTPDPVLLFRYSALTFNGHRIHYDRPYATQEEGYRDLVFHGPLTATYLQDMARRLRPEARLAGFEFRGMSPIFVDRPFQTQAAAGESPDALSLWARGPEGELCMKASARFEDR
ncbi:MaoC family dehydratase N-terminal domain-containing protein [Albimonas sp. CAU 1670]|uniref:FAS1-like dehydratase domain-containing protein n=1 Tax=Albimonas sp. CAU 1670 TaxID=3032599 RepID=UPI0023DA85BE|nr:MaoC family dehydratase N-terminal domain-containing protein [Albimonas sp. CAU 1670]MDF2233387.1 MaoC family dehydratase N-terminal domain-containing protein [Albimonas sp. CAU 1670]